MYSQIIENEIKLQKLEEEQKELKRKIEELEKEKDSQSTISQKDNKASDLCDLDIFKKIQENMNKKAKILDNTIDKYRCKTISIINDRHNTTTQSEVQKESSFSEVKTEELSSSSLSYEYEPMIFKIPSILLDNKIEEISIYIKLEMAYGKITSIESKINFISLLRQVLNNVVMLKHSSFPVFLQLYNFILILETNELISNELNPTIASSHLQSLFDFLLLNKDISEMLRTLVILIKRYFPPNLKIILDNKTVISIKLLLYHLKKIKDIINGSYIHLKLVLGEINDFLYDYPPSGLTKSLPMFDLYIEVFEEMKKVTDTIVKNKKNTLTEITEALSSIKSKNNTLSKDYLKYLEYVVYKC